MTGRRRPVPWPAAIGVAVIAIGAAIDVPPLVVVGLGFTTTYLVGWSAAGRR